tara:strand:+ start:1152 stop:1385 length:234 start_codon:yes stop_codon:yes gene_type:complete
MKSLAFSKDDVVQEILDCISLKQLNGEIIPSLSNDRIDSIADSIIFEWQELGDPEIEQYADFSEAVKWNLEENLSHA